MPPRPRPVRVIPDPTWGQLLVGATPDQRRRFDARQARERASYPTIKRAAGAVMLVGAAFAALFWADPAGAVTGGMILLFGAIFLYAIVATERTPTHRLRAWGVYEEGILCLDELYSSQPGFMGWEEVVEVKCLYEWAHRFGGGPQLPTWTIWVKGPHRRMGRILPNQLAWSFKMDEGECDEVREAFMQEARRHLAPEKVRTVATRGARGLWRKQAGKTARLAEG